MNAKKKWFYYLFLTVFGIIFIYPLIWLVFASFKPNKEVFSTIGLIPSKFEWNAYVDGWVGIGQNSFSTFFINSFILVIPVVLFTVISSTVVAYGFARFKFPFKKFLFAMMLATLMLPDAVIMIPRYLLFRNFGWLDTYLPFYIPAVLAVNAFFIFLLVQFFRGIPKELDEAAIMDGCNSFTILTRIFVPLSKSALFSAGIFQFIWTWNEFFNSLIYINSASKYTVALGLRMVLDNEGAVNWNEVMAMSVVTILPCIIVFFFAQKYFVDGISTSGLKG